jgi:hypothetical protein
MNVKFGACAKCSTAISWRHVLCVRCWRKTLETDRKALYQEALDSSRRHSTSDGAS